MEVQLLEGGVAEPTSLTRARSHTHTHTQLHIGYDEILYMFCIDFSSDCLHVLRYVSAAVLWAAAHGATGGQIQSAYAPLLLRE